jgi:hypothetical protein
MGQPALWPRGRRWLVAAATAVIFCLGGGAVAVYWWLAATGLPTTTPSCSWPVKVRGPATAAQAGLIRCYVRAVTRHDLRGLQELVVPDPPMRVTGADLAHSADARAGAVTALVTADLVDSAYSP